MQVVFGGGRRNFVLQSAGGKRLREDLLQSYLGSKSDGGGGTRSLLRDNSDLKRWRGEPTDAVLGLFADSHLPYEIDRDRGGGGKDIRIYACDLQQNGRIIVHAHLQARRPSPR